MHIFLHVVAIISPLIHLVEIQCRYVQGCLFLFDICVLLYYMSHNLTMHNNCSHFPPFQTVEWNILNILYLHIYACTWRRIISVNKTGQPK